MKYAIDATKITIRDVMTKFVIIVDLSIMVNSATKLMENAKIGIVMENNTAVSKVADLSYTREIQKLPAIEDDKVLGIITTIDLVN